ncbi:MAG: hypothetical protein JSU63_08080 [Phycisphaerales bacterium]|nr:MAG: hypothetical protein JSU63_08080 [Phycisphaerales bacterium]
MRYSVGLIVTMIQMFAVGAAYAQMTPEDIEALRRRGEKEGWTFEVGENWATRNSSARLCGSILPENWEENARFKTPPPLAQPLRGAFDWRDWGGVTEIRNQNPCGSCWAFAAVGALECNIAIKDGSYVDLSEQWLVSCNDDGWGCDGGWFAHDYHMDEEDLCGDHGAVHEGSFPYVAWDAPCNCPYTHRYWISDWAYVFPPTVDAIKSAILHYGPVDVTIHAGYDAFKAYNGGLFNACEDGDTDHQVVLVGWNDAGGGHWILRNSWGDDWGAGGYMLIPYGCSEVADVAAFIEYPYSFKGVWVDFNHDMAGLGTFLSPFNTLTLAAAFVNPGGKVRIKAGSSTETLTIAKAMTLQAVGGTVRIGG